MAALRMREIAVRMTRIHQWTSQYCQTFHGTIRNFRSLTGTSYNFRISRGHQYLSSISTNMGKLGNTRMCPRVSGCYREMHRTISPNRMPHNHQGELRTTREHWGVMWCKHTHTRTHTNKQQQQQKHFMQKQQGLFNRSMKQPGKSGICHEHQKRLRNSQEHSGKQGVLRTSNRC